MEKTWIMGINLAHCIQTQHNNKDEHGTIHLLLGLGIEFDTFWAPSELPRNHRVSNNVVTKFVDREEGGGNRRRFNTSLIKINKHKSKAAAPHGRLPHTKHKLKSRPGPLSSSTVVAPPFILPELLRGTRDR